MAIKPKCYLKISPHCEGELKKFGAILLSPPDGKNRVKKYHICVACYKRLMHFKKSGVFKMSLSRTG